MEKGPHFFLVFLLAFILTYLFTPPVKKLSKGLKVLDRPSPRKVHLYPVPKWGGLALYFGSLLSLILTYILSPFFQEILHPKALLHLKGIFLSATLILLVGMLDDIVSLKPKVKLFFQFICALVLIAYEVRIEFITDPFDGIYYLPKYVGLFLTIFWIVGIINAINLLDGLDGLLAGVSVIWGLVLFIVSLIKGQILASFLLLAITGSCLAFLRYNFNPAQIFMGDTGSLFLGTLWASISIIGALKTTTVAVLIPIIVLALPIVDTLWTIIRRFIKKKPLFKADKEHFHHKLLNLGYSQKQVVIFFYILCGFLGSIAILISSKFK